MSRSLTAASLFVALILLVTPSAAQKSDGVVKKRPESGTARGEVFEWRSDEGQPYWYRLPEKKKATKNLLIMLHGTGVPQGWAFWNYPIAAGKFRPGDIVVAPEGMTPGSGKSFNFIQNDKDGDQIAGLIRTFSKTFEVERVYLYGHSQGAFFCYWFAGRHPELVDGIVAHAGNLLGNVAHPQLAKERVAIAILHGRADAVVPVDCATASEKALRELGYVKLKLEIVEGLTARSGHWPLPGPVAKLLEWLDQVSTADAGSAIAVLERALESPQPVLADLVAFGGRADQLWARHRGPDRKELGERLQVAKLRLDALLDRVVDALAGLDPKAKEDSEAAAMFRLSAGSLSDHPRAKKELRAAFAARRGDRKDLTKALDRLARKRDAKSLEAAAKVLRRRFLATERTELAQLVIRVLADEPKKLKPATRDELGRLIEGSSALETAAADGLRKILARPAEGEIDQD